MSRKERKLHNSRGAAVLNRIAGTTNCILSDSKLRRLFEGSEFACRKWAINHNLLVLS